MKQRVLRSARSSSCSHEWSSLLPGSTHSHTLYRNSNKGSGWSADYWGNTNPVSRGCRMNQTHHLLEVKHGSFQLSFCMILWNRGDARAHGDENRNSPRCDAKQKDAQKRCVSVWRTAAEWERRESNFTARPHLWPWWDHYFLMVFRDLKLLSNVVEGLEDRSDAIKTTTPSLYSICCGVTFGKLSWRCMFNMSNRT